MDLFALEVFRTVAAEKSFSRAAVKLARTQPAISLAVKRLEEDVGQTLIDRTGRQTRLTDAGQVVLDHARRFENLRADLNVALAELRDNSTGRLLIGANEAATLYLLPLISKYRRRYPRVKIQVRRSQSSKIPTEIVEGDLELCVVSYDPNDRRLTSRIIFTDHLACVVAPQHRLVRRRSVSIAEASLTERTTLPSAGQVMARVPPRAGATQAPSIQSGTGSVAEVERQVVCCVGEN